MVIGDDVWLGARVMVVAGVEIGDGCIIGASSVVTRSVPAGSIAVGNPARIIGHRGDTKAESVIREADVVLNTSVPGCLAGRSSRADTYNCGGISMTVRDRVFGAFKRASTLTTMPTRQNSSFKNTRLGL